MRRLHSIAKDAIIQARYRTVAARELAEAQVVAYGEDAMEELTSIYEDMENVTKDHLIKVIGYEVGSLVNEFELGDTIGHVGSAFPMVEAIEESITDYTLQLVDDVIDCVDIPAVTIIDEIEEWLNDLFEYHSAKRDA